MKLSDGCALRQQINHDFIVAKQSGFQFLLLWIVRAYSGDECSRRNELLFDERLLRGSTSNTHVTLPDGCFKIANCLNVNSQFFTKFTDKPLGMGLIM